MLEYAAIVLVAAMAVDGDVPTEDVALGVVVWGGAVSSGGGEIGGWGGGGSEQYHVLCWVSAKRLPGGCHPGFLQLLPSAQEEFMQHGRAGARGEGGYKSSERERRPPESAAEAGPGWLWQSCRGPDEQSPSIGEQGTGRCGEGRTPSARRPAGQTVGEGALMPEQPGASARAPSTSAERPL